MRRVLLLALSSALFLSACGSATTSKAPAAASDGVGSSAEIVATPTPPTNPSIAPSANTMDGEWVTFAPAGAAFASKMPAAPSLTNSTTKTAAGNATTSLWTDEQGGNLSYYIQASAYPAGSLSPAVYDDVISALSASSGLAISTKTDVTVTGHAGKLFLLASALGSIKGEVFIVGDTVYMAYVAFTSSVDMGAVDAFFIDFKFVA